MGFTMPHVLILVGTAVTALALLLQIVGLATPNWRTVEDSANWGLWKYCSPATCVPFSDLGDITDWLKAVRAFGILGTLALVGSLVCAVLIFFMPDKKIFPMAAGAAAAAAAVCLLIEFAVYAGETDNNSKVDFGYSFALTIVAFLLTIGAAVLFLMGMGKTSGAA